MTNNLFYEIICNEARAELDTFQTGCVDLVVTDPPYLVNYRDRDGRRVANDDSPEAVLSVFDEIYRVMKPNSYCISFYGWTAIADFAATWQRLGFRTFGHIAWVKPYASKTRYARYRHESAFILAKGNPKPPADPIDDIQPWEYTGNRVHPTQKAVSVIAPLIQSFSKPGNLVLDPFSGSGSTVIASALNGRSAVGIDLDPKHCATARSRLAGLSSKIAA